LTQNNESNHTHKVTISVQPKTQHLLTLHKQDIRELRIGNYFYHITAITDKEAKEVALNMFHHSVPIKELENYDIEIVKIENLLPDDPNDFHSEFKKNKLSVIYALDLLSSARIKQDEISRFVPEKEKVIFSEYNTIIDLTCDLLVNFNFHNEFDDLFNENLANDLQDLIFSNTD